jgi:PhnB protein
MSEKKVPAVPDGYLAVTPWAIVDGVPAFLEFLKDVFDAEEVIRLTGDGGRVAHAEARINGGPVMMFDSGEGWPATPAYLRAYVPDVDEVVHRAAKAGAGVVTEPTTLWFGDRIARISDPWGNLWWVHTRVFEPDPAAYGPPDEAGAEAIAMVAATLETEMRRRGGQTS